MSVDFTQNDEFIINLLKKQLYTKMRGNVMTSQLEKIAAPEVTDNFFDVLYFYLKQKNLN